MRWRRFPVDDALVATAVVAVAALCAAFRYLPVIDLPQHHAMVSIIANHNDPAYGFAGRYTFDFAGRPYATVYLLAAGLARLVPLDAAMRAVVALCSVAPIAGTWALLAAAGRPRIHALLTVPFAFGFLWHWGFLNFLLGTGLFLALLALVIATAERATGRRQVALGLMAVLLLFTHIHGLFMLLGLAPLFAWAWRREGVGTLGSLRACLPLVPAALLALLFVLTTWTAAEGPWARVSPGLADRLRLFPELLGAGIRDPWPVASLVAVAAVAAAVVVLAWPRFPADRRARRRLAALLLALASQVLFYLALPLNTSTATFLSGRHALLCVLLALPLLPALTGARAMAARVAAVLVALITLIIVANHLQGFDREARDFDRIRAAVEPDRVMATLIFEPRSPHVHPRVTPYLHFGAYCQAERGGDLSRSFALVWNVPIRYRDDYDRYPLDEAVEYNPWLFSLQDDLPHFDYLLIRAVRPPVFPPELGLRLVSHGGSWSLWANPGALQGSP